MKSFYPFLRKNPNKVIIFAKKSPMILFKKQSSAPTIEIEEEPTQKSETEIIQEIHETFYSEVDRLLVYANQFNSLETDKQDLVDKCKRLKELGFEKTQEVVEGQKELRRIEALEKENIEKKELIEAINYFSNKYPIYKFITDDSVRKICEKYGLVYGGVKDYKGTVPDKNLKQIEDFKISEDDMCYFYQEISGLFGYSSSIRYFDKKEFECLSINFVQFDPQTMTTRRLNKCSFEIAAPQTDFDMSGMVVENHKIINVPIPDPIVLQPVFFKEKKHYLVVTAWGIEASDVSVVNERMN